MDFNLKAASHHRREARGVGSEPLLASTTIRRQLNLNVVESITRITFTNTAPQALLCPSQGSHPFAAVDLVFNIPVRNTHLSGSSPDRITEIPDDNIAGSVAVDEEAVVADKAEEGVPWRCGSARISRGSSILGVTV